MKGNWCSQVHEADITAAHFTSRALWRFERVSRHVLCWSTPRKHKAGRRLPVPVRRIPADHEDKEEQEGTAHRCWLQLPGSEYLVMLKLFCNLCVQKSIGSEQNPLRMPQNQELDQLLKEGCTFTVLDQPLSLDRLQLKNIDQLNASSNEWVFFHCSSAVIRRCSSSFCACEVILNKQTNIFFAASGLPHSFIIMHQNRYQQWIGAFILQAASESNKVESLQLRCFMLTFPKTKALP